MILVVALIVASALTVRADITRWQYTARRQRQLQASAARALAGKTRRFAVVVMGPLDLFSPGVPHAAPRAVISVRGTFSVPLGRVLGPEYLVAPDTRFRCGATTMSPAFSSYPASRYGQTLLLRSPALRPTVIGDRRQCQQETAETHS